MYFQAGARTVVGTLWNIRDDHAARFFAAFYASLGSGRSVGAAMREARRRAIAMGLPVSAWASFVVIGDDTIVAVPARAGQEMWMPAIALAAFLALIWGARRTSLYRSSFLDQDVPPSKMRGQ